MAETQCNIYGRLWLKPWNRRQYQGGPSHCALWRWRYNGIPTSTHHLTSYCVRTIVPVFVGWCWYLVQDWYEISITLAWHHHHPTYLYTSRNDYMTTTTRPWYTLYRGRNIAYPSCHSWTREQTVIFVVTPCAKYPSRIEPLWSDQLLVLCFCTNCLLYIQFASCWNSIILCQ